MEYLFSISVFEFVDFSMLYYLSKIRHKQKHIRLSKPKKYRMDSKPKLDLSTINNTIVDNIETDNMDTPVDTPLIQDIDEIKSEFDSIYEIIASFRGYLTGLTNEIKSVEKRVMKKMRQAQKKIPQKRRGKRKTPGGFARPVELSDELCSFLGKDEGTKMARTEVTKEIVKYIHENQLQDNQDGRVIKCNDELKALLGVDEQSDDVTYFTLQKYMNRHYISNKTVTDDK